MNKNSVLDVKVAAERGIKRAIDHADSVSPGWKQSAMDYLRGWCMGMKGSGRGFLAEDVRRNADRVLPPPTDPRAWGAVFREAANEGLIVKTGSYAPSKTGHCRPMPLWRAA